MDRMEATNDEAKIEFRKAVMNKQDEGLESKVAHATKVDSDKP